MLVSGAPSCKSCVLGRGAATGFLMSDFGAGCVTGTACAAAWLPEAAGLLSEADAGRLNSALARGRREPRLFGGTVSPSSLILSSRLAHKSLVSTSSAQYCSASRTKRDVALSWSGKRDSWQEHTCLSCSFMETSGSSSRSARKMTRTRWCVTE